MQVKFWKKDESKWDEVIDRLLDELNEYSPDSEEFQGAIANLEKVVSQKNKTFRQRVSPDTMAIVAANLLGILIIVGYERGHVMTSNAKNFILRPKDSHI